MPPPQERHTGSRPFVAADPPQLIFRVGGNCAYVVRGIDAPGHESRKRFSLSCLWICVMFKSLSCVEVLFQADNFATSQHTLGSWMFL